MRMFECHPRDEIFSHSDEQGIDRHFNATAMTKAVNEDRIKPQLANLQLYESLVEHVLSNHGIESHHLDAVVDSLDSPIMLVEFEDGATLIVDGNHRVVKRWQLGLKYVNAAILKPGQWEEFLVTDMWIPKELYAPQKVAS